MVSLVFTRYFNSNNRKVFIGRMQGVTKVGEEEDWKKKTTDRGGWKRLSDEALIKLRSAPHS